MSNCLTSNTHSSSLNFHFRHVRRKILITSNRVGHKITRGTTCLSVWLGLSAEGSEFQTDTHVSVQGVNHHPLASCHLQTLFTLPDSHNIGSDIQKWYMCCINCVKPWLLPKCCTWTQTEKSGIALRFLSMQKLANLFIRCFRDHRKSD